MAIDYPDSADEATAQEICQILEEIELAAQTGDSQWMNKRDSPRRRARLVCNVRYLSPDGVKVLNASGWTRDISRTGLGFVTREHFVRKSQLCAAVQMTNTSPKKLTGTVVYSRMINDGWYLTGMKFESVADLRLLTFGDLGFLSKDPSPENNKTESATDMGQDMNMIKGTRHQQLLKMLKSVAVHGTRTRDTINEVLLCSASTNYELRRASIHACMCIPREEAITALISLLDDPKDKIRSEAAEALGHLSAKKAISPLVKLTKNANPEIALRAAGALGRIGDKSGISIVINHLETDGPHTRLAAMCFGAIVGHNFRPNSQGIDEARRYMAAKQY